jgi:uncharacterized repeat protein (TIGR03803 family)
MFRPDTKQFRAANFSLVKAVLLAGFVLAACASRAQTFQVLHTFTGPDGADPIGGVTISSSGTLYGTTWNGGNGTCRYEECGTVYELAPRGTGWKFSSLYSFNESDGAGYYPEGPITLGPNGALYTTTTDGGSGGYGTVFELQPPTGGCKTAICYWTATPLHAFQGGPNDGAYPGGQLVFDPAGNIYGTTGGGGATNNGVVYELTPYGGGWTVNLLHSFAHNGTDGYSPSGVIRDSSGNLYGATAEGGTGGFGTVYQLMPYNGTWLENILYDYDLDNGSYPTTLIMDQSGNLYGTATAFGTNSGLFFELTPSNGSWIYYVLIIPNCEPGAGVIMDAAGNFYGSCYIGGAHDFGSIFELTKSGESWTITDLHDFTDGDDGLFPTGALALDSSGNLYGISHAGGAGNYNDGLVWEITDIGGHH